MWSQDSSKTVTQAWPAIVEFPIYFYLYLLTCAIYVRLNQYILKPFNIPFAVNIQLLIPLKLN